MEYQIKSGYENMDINAVHDFLSNKSYWASGISLEAVKKSLKYSYCSGVFMVMFRLVLEGLLQIIRHSLISQTFIYWKITEVKDFLKCLWSI